MKAFLTEHAGGLIIILLVVISFIRNHFFNCLEKDVSELERKVEALMRANGFENSLGFDKNTPLDIRIMTLKNQAGYLESLYQCPLCRDIVTKDKQETPREEQQEKK